MPICQNPECNKEIPKEKKYCNEDCLKQHLELKKPRLCSEENLWLGQDRRKRAMETILKLAKELCPTTYKHFACVVSYRTGLSYRKVTDDYLEVLLELGLLKRSESMLVIGEEA